MPSELFTLAVIVVLAIFVARHTHHFQPPAAAVFEVDVTGKRSPQMEDCIDRFLNGGGFSEVKAWQCQYYRWMTESQAKINGIKWNWEKKLAQWDFDHCLAHYNPNMAYCFVAVRNKVRYKTVHYGQQPYTVTVEVTRRYCSYEYLVKRYRDLARIENVCTLREYHSKTQRRLMTKELRKAIMERDNYTCQICGKYMPDGVGLQIDHIVPVSKGGTTVASNLQVLCSKCNRRKSDN